MTFSAVFSPKFLRANYVTLTNKPCFYFHVTSVITMS
uniref:Uncharacterized protein n=1 Tax=Rhizophora mucronata TaxID=61149 RepID=A0A2P2Q694_RHIMU